MRSSRARVKSSVLRRERSSVCDQRYFFSRFVVSRSLKARITDEIENENSEDQNSKTEYVDDIALSSQGCIVKQIIATAGIKITAHSTIRCTYKIPYSVAPVITAVTAKIKMPFPHSLWLNRTAEMLSKFAESDNYLGIYPVRICSFNFGKRKATKPHSHWSANNVTVVKPTHECSEWRCPWGGLARL